MNQTNGHIYALSSLNQGKTYRLMESFYRAKPTIYIAKQKLSSSSITDIIHLCLHNDRKGQELLYRQYFKLFYTIGKQYFQDKEKILESVNESFLKIFTKIEQFDISKGNFESWAKRIVQNTFIDAYRKNKIQSITSDITAIDYTLVATPQSDRFFWNEIIPYFDRLPETTSLVCKYALIDGFNNKEIASKLQITESTCRWHLMTGKKKLKEWLKHYYE